ncbi:hypothetical protein GSI_10058 [Ganoderma sinense ZZ0214-1]|uniref:Fungal-type protein kinase domain-containing protein n=1 Tax=Ganoderma sinense ZZ0214-1 TaxID=1077348 RepID=A0A2G8RZH5_9APHY|nr:hypothetical protein GSI_10058 [Ganoderma sinense ZZ0214-1]
MTSTDTSSDTPSQHIGPSPTHANAASAATYSSTHGSTEEFRSSLSKLLTKDRVQYDQNRVLSKLLSNNSTHFSGDASTVEEIWRVINTDCRKDLDKIRDTTQEAEAKKKGQKNKTKSDSGGPKNPEDVLYPALTNIIDTIDKVLSTRMGGRERKYYRQFLCTGYSPLVSHDPTDTNAFKYKPDFSVVERPKPTNGGAILERPASIGAKPQDLRVEWRHLVAYMEIKSCSLDLPSPAQLEGNPALTQATDYARGVLVYLPFQLYVYGIILCGSEFRLTWTDRGGVMLSPKYSLLDGDGLRTFIRIVLRLTWEMSPYELGQDTSTEYVECHKSLGRTDYPDLRVRMGGPGDNRTWTTFGNPLWLSHTLFGRGTSVWRVLTDEGSPGILKVAWRTVNRTGEQEIYKRIHEIVEGAQRTISGMVNLKSVGGGDVYFKGTALSIPTTVSNLRPWNTTAQPILDMQLHRVVFDDVGKPLWKYKSEEQLFRAMHMALVAHRDLCSLGILHRDISAGNILIRLNPVKLEEGKFEEREMDIEKTEGFLTDFEFASLPRSESEGPQTVRGDQMTGTVAFMASSLLRDIWNAKPGEAVSRTEAQDIESFAWVFVYVVYKHALENFKMKQDEKKALKDEFDRYFPGRSANTVLRARVMMGLPDSNQHILQHLQNNVEHPEHFCDIFTSIWEEVLVAKLPRTNTAQKSLFRTQIVKSWSLSQVPAPRPLVHVNLLECFEGYLKLIGKAL